MSGRGGEGGFSLIESLVAMTLFTLVVGAAMGLMFQSQSRAADRMDDEEIRQVARVSVPHVADVFRMAGYRAGDLDAVPAAEPLRIVVVGDLDDGRTARPCTAESPNHPRPERITFEVRSDGALYQGIECRDAKNKRWQDGVEWAVLAQGLDPTVPLFRFFDADGNELGDGIRALTSAEREALASLSIEFAVRRSAPRISGRDPAGGYQAPERVVLRNLILARP